MQNRIQHRGARAAHAVECGGSHVDLICLPHPPPPVYRFVPPRCPRSPPCLRALYLDPGLGTMVKHRMCRNSQIWLMLVTTKCAYTSVTAMRYASAAGY